MQYLGWQLAVVCGLIALVLGLGMYQHFYPAPFPYTGSEPVYTGSYPEEGSTKTYSDEQINVPNPEVPASLVVIYSTTAATTNDNNRGWQTLHIWRKVGNQAPELLATVGQVGEYPSAIKASPNHRYLAVDVEKAVDLIDIQTKEKKRVYTAKSWISGIVFSQDEKELLVSDGSSYYRSPDNSEPAAMLSVVSLASQKTIRSIPITWETHGDVSPILWRGDDMIFYWPIVGKDCGSGYGPGYYNLSTGVHGEAAGSSLSVDGFLSASKAVETIPNPIPPEMCGSDLLPSRVEVVEPVSGAVLGSVGTSGKEFEFVAFSPDKTEILFKNSSNPGAYYPDSYEYYRQTIGTNTTPILVENPSTLLVQWRQPRSLVESGRTGEDNSLYFGGKPMVTAGTYPQVIDVYLQ